MPPPVHTHARGHFTDSFLNSALPAARQKIAIVDDDDSVRRALTRMFQTAGWNVSVYDSGAAFLQGISRDPAGCVILDLLMPGVTGLEVLAAAPGCDVHCPIIALSAQDDTVTREKARQLGAAAFFRKPVDDQALLDAVRWVIGQESSR
jgi:FixJ family two-component response regulator